MGKNRVSFCSIVSECGREQGLPLHTSRQLCRRIVEALLEHIDKGDDVTFHGLGSMKPKERAPYVGFNPAKGVKEQMPGYKQVVFTLSKKARKRLNGR